MAGHPAQPAGQPEHRDSVGERLGLLHHRHGLPRRNQPGHRAGPGMPVPHGVDGMIEVALVFDAHVPPNLSCRLRSIRHRYRTGLPGKRAGTRAEANTVNHPAMSVP